MEKSVLIVGNFFSSSLGIPGVCTELAGKLSESQWSVEVTSRKLGRFSRLLDMLSTAWRRKRTFQVAQVDVYSGLAFFWAEAVCEVLRRIGKPYLLTLHGGNLPLFAEQWPKRVRRLLGSAFAVTAPSRYLVEKMKSYREDLQLLPNPLDVDKYAFRLRKKPRPNVLWLRSFHHTYNPELAVRTISILAEQFRDISLTMIGPDKKDGSLQATRRLATQLRVEDRLKLPGAIPKASVPQWLNSGDIFINTTNVDNTPITILEALASGLCVVSTNVGGIPYLLEHDKDALLVPAGDPAAMAAAVRRILTDTVLAEQLSSNARSKAEQFDWPQLLPQWEALLTLAARAS